MRSTPEETMFLCDSCNEEFLIHEMIYSGNIKACKACVNTLPEKLTPTQHYLLIFLFNHKKLIVIDQGNLLHTYNEATGNEDFNLTDFLMDIQVLVMRKFVKIHTLNAFYKITEEGIKYLDNTTKTIMIFQCDRCGDIWSPDIENDMIIDAFLAENPDEHISVSTCDQCEIQDIYEVS